MKVLTGMKVMVTVVAVKTMEVLMVIMAVSQ